MLALLDLVSLLPMNKAAANHIDFSRFTAWLKPRPFKTTM
jgi:hypothetical protein